jgi:signal peptidase I
MTTTETTTAAKHGEKSEFWDNVQTILIALLLAMVIRFIIVQPFRIPSGSMQPTLLVGDYILVTKWSYGYSRFSFEPLNFGAPDGRMFGSKPERGDVIVFRPTTPSQRNKDFVKRLVGMPGDTVQVKESVLYINGEAVQREYIDTIAFNERDLYGRAVTNRIPRYRETLPNGVSYLTFDRTLQGEWDNTEEYVVPQGHYFMMGDDRDNSSDSRVSSMVGYVPFDHLVGKAQFVVVSFDPLKAELFLPWTWITGLRGDRFFEGVP